MIDSVPQDMDDRLGDFFQNTAIEFDLFPCELKTNLFSLLTSQVTHQPRKPLGYNGKRQHARFENLITQITQQRGKLVERLPAFGGISQSDGFSQTVTVGNQLTGDIDQMIERFGFDANTFEGIGLPELMRRRSSSFLGSVRSFVRRIGVRMGVRFRGRVKCRQSFNQPGGVFKVSPPIQSRIPGGPAHRSLPAEGPQERGAAEILCCGSGSAGFP